MRAITITLQLHLAFVPNLTHKLMRYTRRTNAASRPVCWYTRTRRGGIHPRNRFTQYSPLVIIQLLIIGRHRPPILIRCFYEVTPIRPRTTSWRC